MKNISIKKLVIICGCVVMFTLLISLFVRIVVFPVPDRAKITEKAIQYVEDYGGYDIVSAVADKSVMLDIYGNCWVVKISAISEDDENRRCLFTLTYHPITGRLKSADINDNIKILN